MKIVFMGTPEFAVPTLSKLVENYEVAGVFTQPDRPRGRGKKLSFSPVKEEAIKHNIQVFQPERIRKDIEAIQSIKELKPDFIIVVAYGQILPKEVLDIPTYGCINLHASLLPKYRGAAPINWCIINGEKVSGNTTMLMDVGLDTGDILLQSNIDITKDMTAGELHDLLMIDGADLMVKTIDGVVKKTISGVKQQEELSSYASMLNKELAKIDWNKSAEDIHNLIRGLSPKPIAYTNYNKEAVKIFKSELQISKNKEKPGTIIKVDKNGITVAAKENNILIKEIQFPNGKRMTVEEYIRGNTIEEGNVLE